MVMGIYSVDIFLINIFYKILVTALQNEKNILSRACTNRKWKCGICPLATKKTMTLLWFNLLTFKIELWRPVRTLHEYFTIENASRNLDVAQEVKYDQSIWFTFIRFCMRHASSFASAISTPLLSKILRGFLQHTHLHSLPQIPFILRQLHRCVLQPVEHVQIVSPDMEELDDFLGLLAAKVQQNTWGRYLDRHNVG